MRRVLVFMMLFFIKTSAFGFIDAFFKPVEKMADKALILDSLADLLNEIQGNQSLENELRLLSQDITDLEKEAKDYKAFSRDTKDLLSPSLGSLHALHQKIRYSTNYIKRVKNFKKSLVSKLGASASAVQASEQMKTNALLNENLRNQYLLEIKKERQKILSQKRKVQLLKEEEKFLKEQFENIKKHSQNESFGAFHPFHERKRK